MRRRIARIFMMTVIVILTVIVSSTRFAYSAFPDSKNYVMMVDLILMRAVEIYQPIPSPFIFRVFGPLVASPLALFVPTITALSVVGLVACVGLTLTTFEIARLFTRHDIAALIVTLATLGTVVFMRYGGVPLVESLAMLFCALIVYYTLKEDNEKKIIPLVVFGVLTKELVLFAVLFHLLYTRGKSLIPLIAGVSTFFYIRILLKGSIVQPLGFHLPQAWVQYHTLLVLVWLLILTPSIIIAWVRYNPKTNESVKLFFLLGVSFLPYYLLGVFNAYFSARFVWPLQLAFIGICAVGIDSGLSAIIERLKGRGSRCPFCKATGRINKRTCIYCDGTGIRRTEG